MGGSSRSLASEGSCPRAPRGNTGNEGSGRDTAASGLTSIGSGGRDTVACGIIGNDSTGPDIVYAGSGGGMATCTVHAGRQTNTRSTGIAKIRLRGVLPPPAEVATTGQAAFNVRWRVPLIVSVSPEPRNCVEYVPARVRPCHS